MSILFIHVPLFFFFYPHIVVSVLAQQQETYTIEMIYTISCMYATS
jgi:hypothetical protein